MKFGDVPVAEAEGTILAHSVKLRDTTLKKGRILSARDIEALTAAGLRSVVAARLDAGDVGEDAAAANLAKTVAGPSVRTAPAFTGRVNLFAEAAGLCVVDAEGVDGFNLISEAVTLATLPPWSVVEPGQMVATVKIIPFAVDRGMIDACTGAAAERPLLRVAPFRPRRAVLIQTRLPGLKDSILDKTAAVTRDRLVALSSSLIFERRCAHDTVALTAEIAAAITAEAELVLIAGASAIVDRRDVIPAAVVAAGGAIEQLGMPVDPGNLLLLANIGDIPVLGLPGCARSPKVNGFDWVLQRLVADIAVDAAAIRRMGVGGLLAEIPNRPLPRAEASRGHDGVRPRIAAVVLAAGQSRRMGPVNKLLITVDGKPMVRHIVEAAIAGGAAPIVVVTGHEADEVALALAGLPVTFIVNPAYADGLSTSLKRGISAVPPDCAAALVCLGDMPRITADEIARLIAAFNPLEGRGIVVPTWQGKRGNPVLWDRAYFEEMRGLGGDVGARHLIGQHPEAVADIAMDSDAVLTDIDTPEALQRLVHNSEKIFTDSWE